MFRNAWKWAKCGFKCVFGSARKPLGNRLDFQWYLPWQQLMMEWAEVILSEKLLLVSRCFTNKMVLLGFAKSKAINFSFKDYFDRSICNFQRLTGQKTLQIPSSSRICSMRALGSIQINRSTQTSLSTVCSMYWQKYKSQIVGLCSFNNF